MIIQDIITGHISLICSGEEGFIKRKSGEKIKIPSNAEFVKLSNQAFKTESEEDRKKLIAYQKKVPKLMDGDTIISGKSTSMNLSSSYNKGKDKPIEGYQADSSIIITLFSNSEAKISGIETWDRKDEKAKTRWSGERIKNIEILKGSFSCIYTRTDEPLLTPVASIEFVGNGGSGNFDIYQDNLYCWPLADTKGGVIFTNRQTKKKFQPKLTMPEEIIVTKSAIFRKPFTKMDSFSLNKAISGSFSVMSDYLNTDPDVIKKQASSMKNLGKVADQGMSGMEMIKGMSPEDLERLVKQSGQKIDPDQLRKIKEMPAMLKEMEKSGQMEQMKKGFAMMKGMSEGMGDAGIASMMNLQAMGMKKAAAQIDKLKKDAKAEESKPKNYGPLTAEFKVA